MKKMNKMELEAVAHSICNDLEAMAKVEQDKLDKANKLAYTKQASQIQNELINLSAAARAYLEDITHGSDFSSMGRIRKNLRIDQTKINFARHANHYAIERKLIIAQIECDDMATLITSVTESFIN